MRRWCRVFPLFALFLLPSLAPRSSSAAAPPHPRLFVTPAALDRARSASPDDAGRRLGFDPDALRKELRAQADAFAKKPYHYEVDVPGPSGRRAAKWAYTLSASPPPPHSESRYFPVWAAMFQELPDSVTTRLKTFLVAWLATRDDRYYQEARKIVTALVAWPGLWSDPSLGEGKANLDTAHIAMWVGLYHDWCYEAMTAGERAAVQKALAEKALAPLDRMLDEVEPYHNYNAVLTTGLGLGALSLVGHDPRAAQWVERAVARARAYFDAQGSDGGPLEGSAYGTYAVDALSDLLWALDTAGVSHALWDDRYLRTLPRYAISLLDPNTETQPTFGDGPLLQGFPRIMLHLALRGDPEAAWYCQETGVFRGRDPRLLLLLDPGRIRISAPAFPPSAAFEGAGYAVLRDGYGKGAAFVAFKAGPERAEVGHNHYDHNSLILSYGEQWLLADPGSRNRYEPAARRYTIGTLGHNSLILDLDEKYLKSTEVNRPGHDQVNLNEARIAEFFAGERFDYVLGQAAGAYNPKGRPVLERFDRQVVFAKPSVVFVRDTIAAPEPHAYSLLFHLGDKGKFDVLPDRAVGTSGLGVLQVQPFSPSGVGLSTASYPGAERLGPYLAATTGRGREATVTTVLIPRRQGVALSNPGFEAGLSDWKIRTKEGFAKNHVLDTAVKRSGKASARIDNGGYYYSARLSLPPGTRVTGLSWARSTAPGGARASLIFWRGGKNVGRKDGTKGKGGDWAPLEVTGVVPEGAQEVSLALEFFGKGAYWFDDAELVTDPRRTGSEPGRVTALKDGAAGAVAEVDGATHVLLCGEAGARREVTAAGRRFATDAELAAVTLGKGEPGVFLLRGTYLEMDGRRLTTSPGEWRRPGKP